MTSVGHDIVVVSTFHYLMRHGGHHDGCRMRSGKCLPFRSAWFHLWFSWKFVLSCHLCLLVSCDGLIFWLFLLFAWYLYFLPFNCTTPSWRQRKTKGPNYYFYTDIEDNSSSSIYFEFCTNACTNVIYCRL